MSSFIASQIHFTPWFKPRKGASIGINKSQVGFQSITVSMNLHTHVGGYKVGRTLRVVGRGSRKQTQQSAAMKKVTLKLGFHSSIIRHSSPLWPVKIPRSFAEIINLPSHLHRALPFFITLFRHGFSQICLTKFISPQRQTSRKIFSLNMLPRNSFL